MSDKVDLKLDWCSYEAAKYAVEHWHYSKVVPVGKLVKIGVWEDGQYKFDIAPPSNKHKYLFPLDDAMRKQIEPLRKPYPKRGTGETDNALQSNAEIEGASPIVPLMQEATE